MLVRILIVTSLLLLNSAIVAETTFLMAKGYLDVEKSKLIEPANLLVVDGKIQAINPSTVPESATVIDLEDKILSPGFMDMHTHLDIDFEGSFDYIVKENTGKGVLRGAKNAELTLMAGFTTVRNMGQVHISPELLNVALVDAEREGWILAPTIIPAGHMITIQGGHGDVTLGYNEGLIELDANHGIVNGVDDVIKAVRYQIKHGAKVIKIHATAGVLSHEDSIGAQQMTIDEMRAAVEEAHRHDLKVGAHAHGTVGIKAAIEAGVDSIEHGSLLDDEAIEMMIKHGVYLVPTTGLIEHIEVLFGKMDPKLRAKAEFVLPKAKANLGKAIKAGVKIALGSDTPVMPHGKNGEEIVALVDRGMTTGQALQAATINAADLVGLPDRGVLKQGMIADIIALNDNPLKDIKAVLNVPFVMKSGKVVKNQ